MRLGDRSAAGGSRLLAVDPLNRSGPRGPALVRPRSRTCARGVAPRCGRIPVLTGCGRGRLGAGAARTRGRGAGIAGMLARPGRRRRDLGGLSVGGGWSAGPTVVLVPPGRLRRRLEGGPILVRPRGFSRFRGIWVELPWPVRGVGRSVHGCSLVRPPGRASSPAYRGGLASATRLVHSLGGCHTADRLRGLGWNRPDRSLASVKGVAVAIQADAIASYLAELTVVEDDVLRHARDRASAGGMPPVSADSGAFLRFVASWVGAQAAVEVGSGAGYSGVWIARGLAPKGILTTIEADPAHQRLAKETYEEAGVPSRVRAILGRALDVLPRLTDGGYDLAFLDAVKSEYPEYLEHALRLVRPGGVIIADNVLWSGRVADPKATDPDTEGLRAYARRIVADDRLDSVILTVGDGLAVSRVRRQEKLGA